MTTPLLQKHGITDKKSWYKWILKNHPDKGGDHETFTLVKNDYEKYIRDGHKYHATPPPPSQGSAPPPAGGGGFGANLFPKGTTNWFWFEELKRRSGSYGPGTHASYATGGQNFYTQSDGFSHTHPSGKFWDQPKKPKPKPKASKRKGCYGQTPGIRVWCSNPVGEGEKFCERCKKNKCNHLVKDDLNRGKKQCSRKKRPDDDFCSLHSKKPPQKKMTQKSIQCGHIKKNKKRCGNKSKNKYCHLHRKFHTSTETDNSFGGGEEKKTSD